MVAEVHESIAIDLPGHGGSSEVRADLNQSALLIADRLDQLHLGSPATVIGYSLGGRTALHQTLVRPELVHRLVLIGASGGIDDPSEREQRRLSDEALADHLEEVGLERFLDEWLAQPLFSHLTDDQSQRTYRSQNSVAGLCSSLRLCGTGTQKPLWERLSALTMPTLVLAGSNDAKFCEIGKRLAHSIGSNATFKTIADTGHSPHLERPTETLRAISSWSEQQPS